MVNVLQIRKMGIDGLLAFLILSGFSILSHRWEKNSHVWKMVNMRGDCPIAKGDCPIVVIFRIHG